VNASIVAHEEHRESPNEMKTIASHVKECKPPEANRRKGGGNDEES